MAGGFNASSVMLADVDGSGLPSVLQGSAVYDLRGYKLGGVPATNFPKFTGGWVTQTPSVGDVVGDGGLELAVPTREGNLFVWRTGGSACGDLEWPKFQHDLHNSGDYDTDATPPGVLRDAALHGATLTITASGDNGYCSGAGSHYVVTVDGVQHQLTQPPAAAGTTQTIDVSSVLGADPHTVSVSEEDAAGNLSYPAVVLSPAPPTHGHDSGKGSGNDSGDGARSHGLPGEQRATRLDARNAADSSGLGAPFAVLADVALIALVAALLRRTHRFHPSHR